MQSRREILAGLSALGAVSATCAVAADTVITEDDPRIAAGYARLRRYWDDIGPSDGDLITYLVNPQFEGAPPWPGTRQAYRVVRPAGSLIIASDGLSDPFLDTDMTDVQGFGCEVYIEAPELAGASFDTLRGSWAFAAIEMVAQNVADAGGLSDYIEKYGVISMELPLGDIVPDAWQTPSGSVGCLINMPVAGRASRIADMPFGPVDMFCVKLITPGQTEGIAAGGKDVRDAFVSGLSEIPGSHVTRLEF